MVYLFYSLHISTSVQSKHTQNNMILLLAMVPIVAFSFICTQFNNTYFLFYTLNKHLQYIVCKDYVS